MHQKVNSKYLFFLNLKLWIVLKCLVCLILSRLYVARLTAHLHLKSYFGCVYPSQNLRAWSEGHVARNDANILLYHKVRNSFLIITQQLKQISGAFYALTRNKRLYNIWSILLEIWISKISLSEFLNTSAHSNIPKPLLNYDRKGAAQDNFRSQISCNMQKNERRKQK